MGRVIDPLQLMGAEITSSEGGRPPLRITGGRQLRGIHYDLPMASAQVKSCVLLAGLYGNGRTSVTEPAPTRDHTERMLRGFGYQVSSDNGVISLEGGGSLRAADIDVPADISSATFFLVAASIAQGSDLVLTHVGINPTRIGVLNILGLMGADISLNNEREVGGEPVADIHVRYAPLKGIEIPEDQVPLAIDEFPALFIAAACAEGRTVLRGAKELRVKESDRIAAMAEGLTTLGRRRHQHLPRSPHRYVFCHCRPARRGGNPHPGLRPRGDLVSRLRRHGPGPGPSDIGVGGLTCARDSGYHRGRSKWRRQGHHQPYAGGYTGVALPTGSPDRPA
jgi:3-phosphoshikimate 1-carboxyvinyltransferase